MIDYDNEQIEIAYHPSEDKDFRMDANGMPRLRFTEAEVSASRLNGKEQQVLAKCLQRIEMERRFQLRSLNTELQLELQRARQQQQQQQRRLQQRSQLTPQEAAQCRRQRLPKEFTPAPPPQSQRRIEAARRRLFSAPAMATASRGGDDANRGGGRRRRQRTRPATATVARQLGDGAGSWTTHQQHQRQQEAGDFVPFLGRPSRQWLGFRRCTVAFHSPADNDDVEEEGQTPAGLWDEEEAQKEDAAALAVAAAGLPSHLSDFERRRQLWRLQQVRAMRRLRTRLRAVSGPAPADRRSSIAAVQAEIRTPHLRLPGGRLESVAE